MTIVAAAILAIVWSAAGLGWALVLAAVYVAGWVIGRAIAGPPFPEPVRRLPTSYEREHRRRWRLGFGLAVTHIGPFPFITIRRS